MNSKHTIWHGDKAPEPSSSTQEVECKVFRINYTKPKPTPKKGRTLGDFVSEWSKDEEKQNLLSEAKVWAGQAFENLQGGETPKSLRLKAGLSQSQLAALMQTSQPHIARIESGRDSITFDTFCKLSECLKVDYSILVAAIKLAKENCERRK